MSKDEENAEKYYYTCEECDLSFDDFDQHIQDYHADAEVVLKPEEDEENVDDEEMEVEFLDDAMEKFECSESPMTFASAIKLDKQNEVEHDPKNLDDFVVYAYDPSTKKCKKITFSVSGSSADPTVHSQLHRQYYNAFTSVPIKPEETRAKRDIERLPIDESDKYKDGFYEEDSSAWTLTCELCDTKFRTVGALRLHRKAHDDIPVRSIDEVVPESVLPKNDANTERYFCEICERSFDLTYKELHIASHAEQRVFCKICNRKFATQENLDSHMRALPDHMPFNYGRQHETDPEILKKRPHECGFCGKRFPRPREKLQHERIHNGARPFKCEICLKTFRTAYSLRIHLRHHTDLRPYHCHICDKRFKMSGNLKEHVATHFDERNFQCTECPKAYKTSKGLSNHKLSHGQAFMHKCPKCSRTFSRSISVKKHLLTHDSGSKISCSLCDAVFTRKDFLQIHMQRDHLDHVEVE